MQGPNGENFIGSKSTNPMFMIETLMKKTKSVVSEKHSFEYQV